MQRIVGARVRPHDARPRQQLTRLPYSIDERAIHSVSRGELNKVLLTEAEKPPNVTLHFDHRCTVDLDTATCSFTTRWRRQLARADVVLGADGAPMRRAAGDDEGGASTSASRSSSTTYKDGRTPGRHAGWTPTARTSAAQAVHDDGAGQPDGGFTGTLFMPHEGEYPSEPSPMSGT